MKNSKSAFTLAEVLITLAIIGVVAAMTIPSIMQKTQDQEIKTAAKKAFAELSQANMQLVADNGGSIKGLCATNDHQCLKNLYLPYLKTVKSCESPNNSQCITSNVLSAGWQAGSSLILASGAAVNFIAYDSDCTTTQSYLPGGACGEAEVDVNGFKAPNAWHKEIMQFEFSDTGVKLRYQTDANFMTN